jgi:hypothetical protein
MLKEFCRRQLDTHGGASNTSINNPRGTASTHDTEGDALGACDDDVLEATEGHAVGMALRWVHAKAIATPSESDGDVLGATEGDSKQQRRLPRTCATPSEAAASVAMSSGRLARVPTVTPASVAALTSDSSSLITPSTSTTRHAPSTGYNAAASAAAVAAAAVGVASGPCSKAHTSHVRRTVPQ